MKKYQYICKLITDVIITANSATEGYKESLDYIPGSKFLGIVAGQLYEETNQEKTTDLFHNGKVKYGEALPLLNEEILLKVPFSWYHEKGEKLSDTVYLHHLLKNTAVQLKQARTGYFSETERLFTAVDQNFALKSAQDSKTRKSADGQMFGYYSLKAGTEWVFTITDETGKYAEEIKSAIAGKHRIGRSRSAEFGLVQIEFSKEVKQPEEEEIKNEVIIYAKSNLCFYDESTGQTTTQPTAEQLTGAEDAEILWGKCQVRTRNYKTWNRYRYNKNADREIIERGSVFVVKLNSSASTSFFAEGIGAFNNEGFGEVLINPSFLLSETEKLPFTLSKTELQYLTKHPIKEGRYDDEILNCLKSIKSRNDFDFQIDRKVNMFIKENGGIYKGISKSQWGALRNYGKNIESIKHFEKLIFDKDVGLLYRGQSESQWRSKSRRKILEDYLNNNVGKEEYLSFVVKLSNQMAKN